MITMAANTMPPARPKSASPACAANASPLATRSSGTRYRNTAEVAT
jgi:hypothetical protein